MNTLRETTGAAPIRSRTSCAKPVQTYIKHVPKMLGSIPKSTKIVTRRGPKSMKIGGWMGLGPLFVVFGALGREFSGKLRARCAKLGQDGTSCAQDGPRWRQDGHLGLNFGGFGAILGVTWTILGELGEDLGGVLAHGWESKNQYFPLVFRYSGILEGFGRIWEVFWHVAGTVKTFIFHKFF